VRTTPDNDNTPTFIWVGATDEGSGVQSYLVRMDDSGWTDIGDAKSYTHGAPLLDGSHTFQVKAVDKAGNESDLTASLTFTLDTVAPDIPALVQPWNATYMSDNIPFLEWSTPTDASTVHYQLQVASDSGFSSLVLYKKFLVASWYTLTAGDALYHSEALSDGTCYWRVKAIDNAGNESDWTASRTFTVDTVAPEMPTLIYPADGKATTDNVPQLGWSDVTDPSGVTYQLQIDNNSDYASPEVNKAGLTIPGYTLTAGEALPDGLYYWRVRAVDGAGNAGAWRSGWWVRVDTLAPIWPYRISPANGDLVTSTPTFDWADVSDLSGVTYELQTDDNADYSSPVLSKTSLTASGYTLTAGEALPAGTYYWRVRVVDGAGNASVWRSGWSFVVT
jgi:predicted phage tail protein